jgi:hypothetical protein
VGPHITKMETVKLNFQVERKEIGYLRWIVESYDGIAFLKTIEPFQALIELEISCGCEMIVLELLESLRKHEQIQIVPITRDAG